MTNAITDKTRVVVTRLGDYWVTPTQADKLTALLDSDTARIIEIEGNVIRCTAIDGILTPEDYEKLNAKRRGGWQCKWQYMHERGQQCAHGQLGR